MRRNVEDFRKAISTTTRRSKLDPNYALAYAERGEAWAFMGDLPASALPRIQKRADAEKAVAIAPALAEARAALGWVRLPVRLEIRGRLERSESARKNFLQPIPPPTICWRELSFTWGDLMRPSARHAGGGTRPFVDRNARQSRSGSFLCRKTG